MAVHNTFTTAEFKSKVLESSKLVLVDFWAEWCGPCRMIAPILDDLSQEYAGRLKIVKVNVDENSVSAATYGVRGIPTLLLFKNGELAETKVGALPKGQLAAFIDSNI
jgi:thioredoxin 1